MARRALPRPLSIATDFAAAIGRRIAGRPSSRASVRRSSRPRPRRPEWLRSARHDGWVFASLCALCLVTALAGRVEAKPARIVSMNLCADELLLRLAGRERVASVTWLAADPRGSTVTREAAGLPQNHGLAEEIAGLEPDLVVAGVFTTRTAVGLLRRIGFPVYEIGSPGDFDALRAEIRRLAEALGEAERGEKLVAELDARLAAAAPKRPSGLRALVMRPNALTVSPGSFGDAIIRAAGLVNVAAELGRGGAGEVPLEVAAFADADLVIVDAEDGAPSLATAILRHPVFQRLAGDGRLVAIPNRLWTCPGPQAAEVVRLLAEAASKQIERRASRSPLPSAGEGGPRVSEGRERGAPLPDEPEPAPLPPRYAGHPPPQRGEGLSGGNQSAPR